MLKNISITLVFVVVAATGVFAQNSRASGDVLMVMPFENKSGKPEFNWVGESFAESLSDLFTNKGLNIITNSERKVIQQSLKVPLSSIPSLATSVKIGQKGNSSLLVVGSYDIPPVQGDSAIKIYVKARVIRVADGRILSEDFADGRRIEFIFEDALGNVQTIQGQLAREILYRIDKVLYKQDRSFPFPEQDFINAANKIPAKAFEAYIKGLLTSDLSARENYFKNALRLYAEDKERQGAIYSAVALELGHLYLSRGKSDDAIEQFGSVVGAFAACRDLTKAKSYIPQCRGEESAEAAFYLGWVYWQKQNFELALASLQDVKELKLVSVNNLLAAITIQASRSEKKNTAKAADFITKAIEFLKRAVESSDNDTNTRFNYGLALFLNQNYQESAIQFRDLLAANPTDGESSFLAAKAFGMLQDKEKEAFADNMAKKLLVDQNRYAKLQQNWTQSQTIDLINVRLNPPSRNDFVGVLFTSKQTVPVKRVDETQELISQARVFYKDGNDDAALEVIRRILLTDPMAAEAYFLRGMIYLRRASTDEAISNLRTAFFWNPNLIEASIALGKIYLQKGDCPQAKNYAATAVEINSENQDALALQRLSERCSK